MLFNNDLLFIVGSVIVGGLFTYTFYNNIFTNNNSESLVNTNSNLDQVNSVIVPSENTTPIPIPDPTKHSYVDAAVQTEFKSYWQQFKDWFQEAFSLNSTEIPSVGERAIINWKNNLDSIQSVNLHDSGTPLSSPVGVTSELDKLIDPIDSASNVSEVVSNVSTISTTSTTSVVDTSYIELFGTVVEIVTSEAAIQAANAALIEATNAGFIGFC